MGSQNGFDRHGHTSLFPAPSIFPPSSQGFPPLPLLPPNPSGSHASVRGAKPPCRWPLPRRAPGLYRRPWSWPAPSSGALWQQDPPPKPGFAPEGFGRAFFVFVTKGFEGVRKPPAALRGAAFFAYCFCLEPFRKCSEFLQAVWIPAET